MTTQTMEAKTPPRSSVSNLKVQVVSDDPVAQAEAEFVLAAFEELKSMGDAELKITVSVDPQSGLSEVIYSGLQKKRSLDVLRKVYRGRREGKR
jgi:hypothetical protein